MYLHRLTEVVQGFSSYSSSGGKQFCNDVHKYILLSMKFKFKFKFTDKIENVKTEATFFFKRGKWSLFSIS